LNRVSFLCPGWPVPWSSHISFSCSWDDSHELLHPAFHWLRWGLTVYLG
jgi:hypothetical protein